MENLELYVNSINQIFSCLDTLDQNLESEDNTANINNLNEYKELAISFAKIIGSNITGNNDNADNNIENNIEDTNYEEGDSNDW